MPSNFTENYQLSQWAKSDQVQMEDFNADNAKIDEALASHAAALAGKGNCQIYTTSYVGSGGVGPANARSLTFPNQPKFVAIGGGEGFLLMFPRGPIGYSVTTSSVLTVTVSWDENSVSWYGGSADWVMMNDFGTTYRVVALVDA